MSTPSEAKIVVVTGASSGVGRAVVRAFGTRGARLGLIARNEEALAIAGYRSLLAAAGFAIDREERHDTAL